MKETHQIDTVNIVGHSMGGLVSMNYIQNYQDYSIYPEINKLAVLAARLMVYTVKAIFKFIMTLQQIT